jgi:plasmid stabilization system protein ParE
MLVLHTRYLAGVSPPAAARLRKSIVEAARSLESFPERGSWLIDSFLPPHKYRKLLVEERYLIIYQVKDSTVNIDCVVDCREDYQWLL